MIKIAPSILSADFSKLNEQIAKLYNAGAQWLHIDFMDGEFVPNKTAMDHLFVQSIRPLTDMVFDAHLMAQHPLEHIELFANAGADIISIHAECSDDISKCLTLIKKCGKKCGIVINPETPVSAIEDLLNMADLVLVMSVNPGWAGQKYICEVESKVKYIRDKMGKDFDIEIDGGINADTVKRAVMAGANIAVAGASIFKSESGIENAVKLLLKEGNSIENGNIS